MIKWNSSVWFYKIMWPGAAFLLSPMEGYALRENQGVPDFQSCSEIHAVTVHDKLYMV